MHKSTSLESVSSRLSWGLGGLFLLVQYRLDVVLTRGRPGAQRGLLQCLPAREILVQHRRADPDYVHDLVHGHAVEALLGEQARAARAMVSRPCSADSRFAMGFHYSPKPACRSRADACHAAWPASPAHVPVFRQTVNAD